MAIYTVQDTTMTALGDAVRKQTSKYIFTEEKPEPFWSYDIEFTYEDAMSWEDIAGNPIKRLIVPIPYRELLGDKLDIMTYMKADILLENNENNRNAHCYIYINKPNSQQLIQSLHPYGRYEYEDINIGSLNKEKDWYLDIWIYTNNYNEGSYKFHLDLYPTSQYGEFIILNTYTPAEMIDVINNLITIPDEALTITGNASYRFAYNGWNWFIEKYGDKITTDKLSDAEYMFSQTTELEEIPFKVNVYSYVNDTINFIFYNCKNLKSIKGFSINCGHSSTFSDCENLRYLPDDIQMDSSSASSGGYRNFYSCSSLRKIPTSILKECRAPNASYISSYNSIYGDTFYNCYVLDELIGISLDEGGETTSITSNIFSDRTFQNCNRLKEVQFELNEDGTVKTRNWKNQLINLSQYVGYGSNENNITTRFNSGITADKKVYDNATYASLKDDPDWFSTDINYSRYNHNSAVNTINSLPDCSSSGGTNTIKFTGASGALTDGGAINTLTEEEIAVATAKAWTVSLV